MKKRSISTPYIIPVCSSKIFNPIQIKIIPPISSAFDLNLSPNILPIFTPHIDIINVIIPIKATAGIIFTFRNAKVIPTAKASILVAIDNISIDLKLKSDSLISSSSSLLYASFIILIPIIANKINAIQ